MKALFSIYTKLSAFFTYLFAAPAVALAQTVDVRPKGEFGKLFDFAGQGFGDVVGRVVTILFIISVVIALAFLIYGGIKWITSGGDKAAVEAARSTIVAAVVGLVIVFLSYFILNIVLQAFGLSGFGALVLPKLTP